MLCASLYVYWLKATFRRRRVRQRRNSIQPIVCVGGTHSIRRAASGESVRRVISVREILVRAVLEVGQAIYRIVSVSGVRRAVEVSFVRFPVAS